MKFSSRILFAFPLLTALGVTGAFAQSATPPAPDAPPVAAAPAKEEKLRVLKPGTLAASGRFGFKSPNIPQVIDESAPGSEGSPVVASVKRKSSTQCVAVITNNDPKGTFSVSIEVAKQDGGSKKSFSATLGPKKVAERLFPCKPEDNFAVALKGGKELKSNN